MRRVPSIINPSRLDPCSTVVDLLIQVTSKQAKAHGGAPNPNVDIYQNALIRAHDNFGNELEELKELFHIDKKNQNLSKVMRNFGEAIKCAYLLGSASPEPAMQSRTTKAMEVRKQGWEEPLDKAIEKAVLSNPGASYK